MAIKAIGISKTYYSPNSHSPVVEAAKQINLDINEGSNTFIYGPTGSGKTTLLSLLSGISKPTKGEVVFNNLHLSRSSDAQICSFREKNIGLVPQGIFLIDDLNVLENVLSPNTFLKRRLKELKNNAVELLNELGLHHKMYAKPLQLSGGEKKKLMIARALLKKPLFIIVDEPVSELDQKSTLQVTRLLAQFNKSGSAVVIASHKPVDLEGKVDRYSMDSGKIIEYIRGRI